MIVILRDGKTDEQKANAQTSYMIVSDFQTILNLRVRQGLFRYNLPLWDFR